MRYEDVLRYILLWMERMAEICSGMRRDLRRDQLFVLQEPLGIFMHGASAFSALQMEKAQLYPGTEKAAELSV